MEQKEGSLTAVRCVCAAHPQLASLQHVPHKISALLFQADATQWTLESASKRGFVRMLDHLLKHEWPGFNQKCREKRLGFAISKGYGVAVLKWWLNSYMPGQTAFPMSRVCQDAIEQNHLHIVQWLVQEHRNQLQPECFQCCAYPETIQWLYEYDRHLPVVVDLCVVNMDNIEHIKWCMAVEDDEDCSFIIKWPAFLSAIQHSHISVFPRLLGDELQRSALEFALRLGRFDAAKWLYQNYPECRELGDNCSSCTLNSLYCYRYKKWKCVDFESAQWIFCELEWKDQKNLIHCLKKMVLAAAASGKLDVLEFLFNVPKMGLQNVAVPAFDLLLDPAGIDGAASNGQLAVVQWLHGKHRPCTTNAMDGAAKAGHLDVIQWLHENRSEGCTIAAMNDAAANGYLEIVQWLHENRTEGCTTDAMNLAVTNGHLDLAQWLHENRTEGCTADAFDLAATNGHLDVVQWLHEIQNEGCTTRAMDYAAKNGHLDVVQWLHENRSEGCTRRAMDYAAKEGHLEVVRWLHENRCEGCTTRAMDSAAQFGHLDVVRFLNDNRNEGCSRHAQLFAVRNGRLDIFKWFHDNKSETCPPSVFDGRNDHFVKDHGTLVFVARHPGYIPFGVAVNTLIECGLIGEAEMILREAQADGIDPV